VFSLRFDRIDGNWSEGHFNPVLYCMRVIKKENEEKSKTGGCLKISQNISNTNLSL
jgi:dihydroorotase